VERFYRPDLIILLKNKPMDAGILRFLEDLRDNNNRDWFQKNKDSYLKAKQDFEIFIDKMIPEVRKFDISIDLITAGDCLFRIYKDVRFSKDKSPYKTNMGAFIARGGKSAQFGGYYVHIEPGQCMLAGGIYMPRPEVLKLLRQEIFYNIKEFKGIIEHKNFVKYFGEFFDEDKLVNPPKGFPKDWPDIELLKYKSYTVSVLVSDKQFVSSGYFEYCLEVFKALQPLNEFLNRAVA
jgi:uncharacterized protein (TIGR02453 family)